MCDDIRQAVRRIGFLKHLAAEEVRIESVIPLVASFVARGHAAQVEYCSFRWRSKQDLLFGTFAGAGNICALISSPLTRGRRGFYGAREEFHLAAIVQTSNACDPYLAAGVETPATRIARACVAPRALDALANDTAYASG